MRFSTPPDKDIEASFSSLLFGSILHRNSFFSFLCFTISLNRFPITQNTIYAAQPQNSHSTNSHHQHKLRSASNLNTFGRPDHLFSYVTEQSQCTASVALTSPSTRLRPLVSVPETSSIPPATAAQCRRFIGGAIRSMTITIR